MMMIRTSPSVIILLILSVFLSACSSLTFWRDPHPINHQDLLVLDSHVDIPSNFATSEVDPGQEGTAQVDLVKMSRGNLNTVFFIVYVGQLERTKENFANAREQALGKFEAIKRMTEMYPDRIALARSAGDVTRLRHEGKMVALIGVENGFAFGEDLSLVEDFYQRGMRYAGFSHFGHSNFADSSNPSSKLDDAEEEHGGLSSLGQGLLSELNRLGVMADVSHASNKSALEIATLSKAPVIASHSSVYALNPIARNISDEAMLAIKKTGGVVQIVAFDTYLKDPPEEKKEALQALRKKFNVSSATWAKLSPEVKEAYQAERSLLHEKWPRANLDDFIAHIDYAVNLIGIDHVGIASDFGGGGGIDGWNDASETENVTMHLIASGYSNREIEKLWGKNMLRVMAQVEKYARSQR